MQFDSLKVCKAVNNKGSDMGYGESWMEEVEGVSSPEEQVELYPEGQFGNKEWRNTDLGIYLRFKLKIYLIKDYNLYTLLSLHEVYVCKKPYGNLKRAKMKIYFM